MKRNLPKQVRVPKQVRDSLAKKPACYILITCEEPTEDGHMQVEMTYQGDTLLASYLIQGAQTFMDEQLETPTFVKESKIYSL